jgi:predicted dienelactone hydrolase
MSGRLFTLCLAAVLAALPIAGHAAPSWGVGLHRLTLEDPIDHRPMNAVAFYPSWVKRGATHIDLFRIAGREDTPPAPGHFPLIVLSHGNGGSPLAHHDLASALAHRGFIVLAVQHPGDNVDDQSRIGHFSDLYGRPMQLSAAIDAVGHDELLGAEVDSSQVGVIGYSAGGESALILAGGHPELQHLRQYCERQPDDAEACERAASLAIDQDMMEAAPDARVRSLLLLAPLGLMFGRQDLADVQVPVLLYAGAEDHLLLPAENAEALARRLPGPADYHVVPGAGHFVFMAPCSTEMHEAAPQLCEDGEGVDRLAVHDSLNSDAVRFFGQTLSAHQTAAQL